MKCVQCHEELHGYAVVSGIVFAYCNNDDHTRDVDTFPTTKIPCPLYHVLQLGE